MIRCNFLKSLKTFCEGGSEPEFKVALNPLWLCPSIPKRDFDTKKTTPNIEVWPESLGAMLEYWYIERGLLRLCRSIRLDAIIRDWNNVLLNPGLQRAPPLWSVASDKLIMHILPTKENLCYFQWQRLWENRLRGRINEKKWEAIKQIFVDHKSNSLRWAQRHSWHFRSFFRSTPGHGFQIIKWPGNTFACFRELNKLIITMRLWQHDNLIFVSKFYIYINFDAHRFLTHIHVPYLQGSIDIKKFHKRLWAQRKLRGFQHFDLWSYRMPQIIS